MLGSVVNWHFYIVGVWNANIVINLTYSSSCHCSGKTVCSHSIISISQRYQ